MAQDLQSEQTRAILKKVRQIEIRSRRFVDEALVGAYHSVFKGRGMDFAEVREYLPGDDVRTIDWNVTARMDRPFVKVYEEERELTIMLIVDVSASGDFGSVTATKRELAAELAAVLAFSATRNNDKVGLLLFSDVIELFVPPRKGRQHILRVIREILFFKPASKGTQIPQALRFLNHVLRRKAICFLLSDFLTEETEAWLRPPTHEAQGTLQKLLSVTNRRHDLICVHVEDPRESQLPPVGLLVLEDAESGQLLEIDCADPALQANYARLNAKRRTHLFSLFRKAGIDAFSISTAQPYIAALRAFFQQRGLRR